MSNSPNPTPHKPDTTPKEPGRQQPPRPGDPVTIPLRRGTLEFIKKQVGGGAFQPEEVRILVAAFDAAWQHVQSRGAQLSDYQTEEARNVIAKIITEAACQGERNEQRLTECALLAYAKFKNQM